MDVNKLRGRQFHSQQELNQALGELFAEDRLEYIRQYEMANTGGGMKNLSASTITTIG